MQGQDSFAMHPMPGYMMVYPMIPRSVARFSPQGPVPVAPPSLPPGDSPSLKMDYASSVASTMLRAIDLANELSDDKVALVLVGGMAHMARLQHQNEWMRIIGTWEYGLRDIDLVCVPGRLASTYDDYDSRCTFIVQQFDRMLNEFSQKQRHQSQKQKWWELTQASSDFAVASRRLLSSLSVQSMLKSSSYGITHVWHLDSHQIANVTRLGHAYWKDSIGYDQTWLIFPAWHCRTRHCFSRPVVRLRVVEASYLHKRLAMQLASCQKMEAKRKELFLRVRERVWNAVLLRSETSLAEGMRLQRERERIAQQKKFDADCQQLAQQFESQLQRRELEWKQKELTMRGRLEKYKRRLEECTKAKPELPRLVAPIQMCDASINTEAPSCEKPAQPQPRQKKRVRHVQCQTESLENASASLAWFDTSASIMARDGMFLLLMLVLGVFSWAFSKGGE